MNQGQVTIGVDFGTLSGRAVVVSVADGRELASAVHVYAHGAITERLPGGTFLGPSWALQSPADWRDVLSHAVPEAIRASGVRPEDVVGIATDFTACTVLPVDADGTPLCEIGGYAARPHAWPKLWKHHAAQGQADRINALARERQEPWIGRYGGAISAEWQFAKALEVLEEDPLTYAATDLWVEAADWIVWQLCGTLVRNACTAGYKGILQDGAYPSREFLSELNPAFESFADDKLAGPLGALGSQAGGLTAKAAEWTGLREGTPVAVGNVDAHVTAAAADAVRPGRMVAIMGTSTCHVMSDDRLAEVPGMCGVVDGGIVAGLWGYEAGQSGVGDIFGWFVESFVGPQIIADAERQGLGLHDYLGQLAQRKPVGAHGLVALDWHSGNRSVLVDHDLSGLIVGLTLATPPEDVYRALVESTAFGARMIVETFDAAGVPVREFVAAGGLTRNQWLMQVYADVLGMPIRCVASGQGPALGSAIHAAVAAGAYPDVATAASAMGRLEDNAFEPDAARHSAYSRLYDEYVQLHDWFGRGGNDIMRRLTKMRREVTAGALTFPEQQALAHDVRSLLVDLHAELPRHGLVVWTSGNVSARVPGHDLFVIKPSGVRYESLSAAAMIVCDLDGQVVDGDLRPSSDTAAHAYVYRHMPDVGGVVHTHSPYATAWAAVGEPIPCVLTAMADEFGGEIPLGPFALIGDDSIGRGIVSTLRGHRSPAVLMRSHGVFTVGRDATAAVKAAVMCEDVARTVHLARQFGVVEALDPRDVDALYARYTTAYGQGAS